MSEVHDQAIHLLAQPDPGTYLTPESREMVLRALEEVDALRRRAEKAEAQLADAVAHAKRAQTKLGELREMLADEIADSPAAPTRDVEQTETFFSATPLPTEPAGDVSPDGQSSSLRLCGANETHKSQQSPGKQVAGVEAGAHEEGAGPASAPEHEQDREAGAGRPAGSGSGNGGPPTVPAAARWARPPKDGLPWHAWPLAYSTKEEPYRPLPLCGEEEAAMPEVDLAEGVRPRAVEACVDCATLTGWDAPEKMSRPDPACLGHNKSANVTCGSPRIAVVRDGKPYCKRHDPERKNNGRAEAANV